MRRTLGNAKGCHLRFIFEGAVVSLALGEDATIEDVARLFGSLPDRRYGDPVAIDISIRSHESASGGRKFSESISTWPRIIDSQSSAILQFVRACRSTEENKIADSGYGAGEMLRSI
jgi:hypothetical protein